MKTQEEIDDLTPAERAELDAMEAAYREHREDYEASVSKARAAWAKFAHSRRNGEPWQYHFEQFQAHRDAIPKALWDRFDWSFIRKDSQFGAADPKPIKAPKEKPAKQERYQAA